MHECAQPGERLSLFIKIIPDRRQTHESTQLEARQIGDRQRQIRHLVGCDPGFVVFSVDIDLDTDVQVSGIMGALCAQAACDLEPVNGVNPLKMLGYSLCFVGLQVADEMPDSVVPVNCGDLVQPFLDKILAKIPLSGE